MSRVLVRLILIASATASVVGCSDDGEKSEGELLPNDGLPDESEENAAFARYPLCLNRLGAPDGGAWAGPTRGGRLLLWLGNSEAGDFDAVLAIVRNLKKDLAFGIFELDVRSNGEMSMGLAPLGRDETGSIEVLDSSPRIYILADVQDSMIRIRDTVGDEQLWFRKGTELRRCSIQDQDETKKTVCESIR